MGTRSIKAPLSPREELTLRRIAIGIVAIDELPADTVEHLRGFGLLDAANHLTPAGQERYDSLPRPPQSTVPEGSFLAALRHAARTRR